MNLINVFFNMQNLEELINNYINTYFNSLNSQYKQLLNTLLFGELVTLLQFGFKFDGIYGEYANYFIKAELNRNLFNHFFNFKYIFNIYEQYNNLFSNAYFEYKETRLKNNTNKHDSTTQTNEKNSNQSNNLSLNSFQNNNSNNSFNNDSVSFTSNTPINKADKIINNSNYSADTKQTNNLNEIFVENENVNHQDQAKYFEVLNNLKNDLIVICKDIYKDSLERITSWIC